MAMVICPDCGKEQDNLNKFCRNCGADLSKVEAVSGVNSDLDVSADSGVNSDSGINVDSGVNSDLDVSADSGVNSDSGTIVLEEDSTQKSSDVPIQNENDNNGSGLVILDSEEINENDINKCTNCGTELNHGEKFCPNCGQSTDSPKDNYPKNFCPNCGEKLYKEVKFCPNCGFDINNISNNNNAQSKVQHQHLPAKKEPIVSVILSFVFPGLGQFYNAQSNKGIYFIILAIVSIVLTVILIGWLLYILVWLWSIIDAYNSAEKLNRGEFVEEKLF